MSFGPELGTGRTPLSFQRIPSAPRYVLHFDLSSTVPGNWSSKISCVALYPAGGAIATEGAVAAPAGVPSTRALPDWVRDVNTITSDAIDAAAPPRRYRHVRWHRNPPPAPNDRMILPTSLFGDAPGIIRTGSKACV